MKSYLKKLSKSRIGKKSIVNIFYALNSKDSNKQLILNYLEFMKNKHNIKLESYMLKISKPFVYRGHIQRIVTVGAFRRHNVVDDDVTDTGEESIQQRSLLTAEESRFNFKNLEFKYDSTINSRDNFLWVTQDEKKDIELAEKLGIAYPNIDLLLIDFPEREYELYKPTFIEALKHKWFYANKSNKNNWGISINIYNVNSNKSIESYMGAKEALVKPLILCQETNISFLGRIENDKEYYDTKLGIFFEEIENNVFSVNMINYILEEQNKYNKAM